jgi:transaldolase/glucose-6-phosphate isomerase
MNPVTKLHEFGQSIWYDNIQRNLLENGTMAAMINAGEIWGVTSNPTIFNHAIAQSKDYDSAIKPLAWSGLSNEQVFYHLAIDDIRVVADLFSPVYQKTNGEDGYVSIEVNPYLAHDTEGTVTEVKRLWQLIDRPNLMVKIPATSEGVSAIKQSIAAGINVNVTLIFSLERYIHVIDAYLSGLEERVSGGYSIKSISSVASFFVSRLDTKIDARLNALISNNSAHTEMARQTLGKTAIAYTRQAYELFKETFSSDRFRQLKYHGARLQRPLWASTSTKNPAYRDVMYVEELIAPNTVDTVPPQTLNAFRDHGKPRLSLEGKEKESRKMINNLGEMGISIDQVTQELEDEGVKSFADAYTSLLNTIENKISSAQAELGSLNTATATRVEKMQENATHKRLFDKDATLWSDETSAQAEIIKRLDWLEAPLNSQNLINDLQKHIKGVKKAGYTRALVLGMGGSSLAPEVFATIFKGRYPETMDGLELEILDSTDPEQVLKMGRRFPVEKSLFIVSSKSGSTSEVSAFFDYFWNRATLKLGKKAADHFITITDPGTPLEKLAKERKFRSIFLADPNVGGRYSALIAFGLIPAALIGLDVQKLLERAISMAFQCNSQKPASSNPGLVLGAILGEAALSGRNKLTILADPALRSFGSWLEQLIAESSGKQGKGIIPVDLEPKLKPEDYDTDRIFVYFSRDGSLSHFTSNLLRAGHPVLTFEVPDLYDLGGEFYRWEIATAIACSILKVNAFDQPDVQDSKNLTGLKIEEFRQKGKLAEGTPIWESNQALVYGQSFKGIKQISCLSELFRMFIKQANPGDYIALNAFLPRNSRTLSALQKVRKAILTHTGVATTLGFGPRFLHSTGQLHKGGPDNALFIQITADTEKKLLIPGEGISFGTLERAQALGDFEALMARNRKAIRIHLTNSQLEDLIADD